MSNEYKDWQAEEIKELEAKCERLEKAIQRHKAETEEKLGYPEFPHCSHDRELWATLEGTTDGLLVNPSEEAT